MLNWGLKDWAVIPGDNDVCLLLLSAWLSRLSSNSKPIEYLLECLFVSANKMHDWMIVLLSSVDWLASLVYLKYIDIVYECK